MNQQEKNKFRASSKWKNWRKYLRSKCNKDELTNKPLYKGFQVHHLDLNPDHYQYLVESHFVLLNRKSHDFIHWAYTYYKSDPDFLNRVTNLLNRMKEINTVKKRGFK